MLDAAAVLRGDLSAPLLRAVTGLPSARLAAAIEELIGRRLLRAPTPDTLEFPHEFTARVAYERLTPEQRTALHARAASALAAHAPPDETVPSMVAYHRDLAGLPKSNGRRARVAAFAGAGMLIAVIVAVGLRWLDPVTGQGHPRVLVAAFDNRTGVAALDVVGDMAADWVTQGVAQTGLVPVVDLRSARQAETMVRAAGSNISGASSVEERVRALARETGAGTVVWGSFYRSGDTLVVQSRISDATRGEVMRVLRPDQGSARAAAPGHRAAQLAHGRRVLPHVQSLGQRMGREHAPPADLRGVPELSDWAGSPHPVPVRRGAGGLSAGARRRFDLRTRAAPVVCASRTGPSVAFPRSTRYSGGSSERRTGFAGSTRPCWRTRARSCGVTGLPHERRPRTWPESPRARRRGSSSGQEELKLHRPRHALAAFRAGGSRTRLAERMGGLLGIHRGVPPLRGEVSRSARRRARSATPASPRRCTRSTTRFASSRRWA